MTEHTPGPYKLVYYLTAYLTTSGGVSPREAKTAAKAIADLGAKP